MIDLTKCRAASPQVQSVDVDPGVNWDKDPRVAIDAPPDCDARPLPESTWPQDAVRTGVCGVVSPRVIALPGGGFRMYYSQILPRPGYPSGANDYDNASTRILSAWSSDGMGWFPEAGVRLSPQEAGAGDFRVVSSEVVPIVDGRRLRMYFECCPGSQGVTNSIRSATSDDGLKWELEPGSRVESAGHNYAAPRIVFLEGGRLRMYLFDRGEGIISLVSNDGLRFDPEPGLRIKQDTDHDRLCAFAPEIIRVAGVGYVMYYAGYSDPKEASILRAESTDGLRWTKWPRPVITPSRRQLGSQQSGSQRLGAGKWDAAKASEMCLIRLPEGPDQITRFRILYEACDGTAPGARGVWRIASAIATIDRPLGERPDANQQPVD